MLLIGAVDSRALSRVVITGKVPRSIMEANIVRICNDLVPLSTSIKSQRLVLMSKIRCIRCTDKKTMHKSKLRIRGSVKAGRISFS